MKKASISLLLLSSVLFVPAFCLAQTNTSETLTITTYYPSPYGVYKNLRLHPTSQPTTGVAPGVMFYNNTSDSIMYYNKSNQWVDLAAGGGGGYWAEHDYYNGFYPATLKNIYSANNGDVRIGNVTLASDPGATAVPGFGRFLYFSGGPAINTWGGESDNSDPLWIARYNVANDITQLRVNIGDNFWGGEDEFVVGREITGGGWVPLMTVNSTGNVSIGTVYPQSKLEVNGTVRSGPPGQRAFGTGFAENVTFARLHDYHINIPLPFPSTTLANVTDITNTIAACHRYCGAGCSFAISPQCNGNQLGLGYHGGTAVEWRGGPASAQTATCVCF